jgi:hypothetical protein
VLITGPWPQNDEWHGEYDRQRHVGKMLILSRNAAKSPSSHDIQHDADVAVWSAARIRATPSVSLPGTRHVFNGERVMGGDGRKARRWTRSAALTTMRYGTAKAEPVNNAMLWRLHAGPASS